jgi:hypothetical protein
LIKTARDLGPPGPDDQFGAGEADAFAAVSAVIVPSVPVAAAPQPPATPDLSNTRGLQPVAAENLPAAPTMAAEKTAGGEQGPDMGKTKPETP